MKKITCKHELDEAFKSFCKGDEFFFLLLSACNLMTFMGCKEVSEKEKGHQRNTWK